MSIDTTVGVLTKQLDYHNLMRDAIIHQQGLDAIHYFIQDDVRQDHYGDIKEEANWANEPIKVKTDVKQLMTLIRNKDETEGYDLEDLRGHVPSSSKIKSGDRVEFSFTFPAVDPNYEETEQLIAMEVIEVQALVYGKSATGKVVILQPARDMVHRNDN